MKITDLVPETLFKEVAAEGLALEALYSDLEAKGMDFADEIIEHFIDAVSLDITVAPIIEFALINLANKRFDLVVEPHEFYGYCLHHYEQTKKRQKRKVVKSPVSKYEPYQVKLALSAHIGNPIPVNVLVGKLDGTGEYSHIRGVVLASEDELHFPIGIKPYYETWWYTYNPAIKCMIRVGGSDKEEARLILANSMRVEDSTERAGLELWCAVMGDVTPPAELGLIKATLLSKYQEPEAVDYVKTMPLWLKHTKGTQKTLPRFQVKGHKLISQTVLRTHAEEPTPIEIPDINYPYEDGVTQRKKIDVRRSLVQRVISQGVQEGAAIKPLEQVLEAKLPLWLLMADKREINAANAERVVNVSVASDIGMELANLRMVVENQMKIAQSTTASDKQKSAALARAVSTAKAIMALRKDAGYFEQNNATKAGIFKNTDSTVLQDDGAQFEKLIEQLASQGVDNE